MILNTMERIMLSQLLPQEGTFANLRLLRKVRELISFDEDENRVLKFRQEGPQMLWESDKKVGGKLVPIIPDRDFPIGEVVSQLIVSKLNELNSQAKLTEQHFSLYEKFVLIDE